MKMKTCSDFFEINLKCKKSALMNAIDGLNNIVKVNASIKCASKLKKMESGKTCSFGD
jgi:hypothetical protein